MRTNMYTEELAETDDKLSLAELEFGSVIAKGSNAVVYEAREKSKAGMQCFMMNFSTHSYKFLYLLWTVIFSYFIDE